MLRLLARSMCLLLLAALLAQPAAAGIKFDGYRALKHVKNLCSDEMKGRRAGLEGALLAAEYMAAEFEKYGLEPIGEDGTYFQEFNLPVVLAVSPTNLALVGESDVQFEYGKDFRPLQYSGSGKVEGEVVFVGYGISSPDKGLDEYDGVDVEGKIVLCIRRAPGNDTKKWDPEVYIGYKSRKALEHGAVGFLMVERGGEKPTRPISGTITADNFRDEIPALSVSSRVADDILAGSDKGLRQLQAVLDSGTEPVSFATGKRIAMEVNTVIDRSAVTKNALAVLRGTDPDLRDEYIVVSGHLDHMGPGAGGEIHYGADDDASGTACVLEIARVMAANGPTRRSVIFAGWTAEEVGLVGSRHFVNNPTVPLAEIVCNLQLDMVGRGVPKANAAGALDFPRFWNLVEKYSKPLPSTVSKGHAGGASDHASFVRKKIPAMMIISAGRHSDYHQPTDTPEKISPEILRFCGQLVADAVRGIADEEVIPWMADRKKNDEE